jgi:hypothetical protein
MADSLAAFPVLRTNDFRESRCAVRCGAVFRNENQQNARALGVSQQSHADSLLHFRSVQVN